jgi:hypothetical protein
MIHVLVVTPYPDIINCNNGMVDRHEWRQQPVAVVVDIAERPGRQQPLVAVAESSLESLDDDKEDHFVVLLSLCSESNLSLDGPRMSMRRYAHVAIVDTFSFCLDLTVISSPTTTTRMVIDDDDVSSVVFLVTPVATAAPPSSVVIGIVFVSSREFSP